MWRLTNSRCGGSFLGDFVACRRCCCSLIKSMVAHWWKMLWLTGRRCGGSFLEDVVARMRCLGSPALDVMAHF